MTGRPLDGLQASPAAHRNAPAILDVLARVLAKPGFQDALILEIAAGSGFHAATFAAALPHLVWQPTDPDPEARTIIAANVAAAALPNLRPPLALDVTATPWPVGHANAVVCINMIHISPWEATTALFGGAARLMPGDGLVVTYGPYAIAGDFLAASNVAFDQSLRARNIAWGIRDVNDVARVAGDHGFRLDETIRMPANNLMLIFRKPRA